MDLFDSINSFLGRYPHLINTITAAGTAGGTIVALWLAHRSPRRYSAKMEFSSNADIKKPSFTVKLVCLGITKGQYEHDNCITAGFPLKHLNVNPLIPDRPPPHLGKEVQSYVQIFISEQIQTIISDQQDSVKGLGSLRFWLLRHVPLRLFFHLITGEKFRIKMSKKVKAQLREYLIAVYLNNHNSRVEEESHKAA